MVDGMKMLRRVAMPLGLVALVFTTLSGCVAEVEIRRGRYYNDRVWRSDPWCRHGHSYGCRWDYNDHGRMRDIHRRRWGRDWDMVPVANVAAKKTTWKSEFGLTDRSVKIMNTAFENGLNGNTDTLKSLGFTPNEIRRMASFKMPSGQSIYTASERLGVDFRNLKDFLEVYMIRMKAAYEANERYE